MEQLQTIFENKTKREIQSALDKSKGCLELATSILLKPTLKRKTSELDPKDAFSCLLQSSNSSPIIPLDCISLHKNFLPESLADSLLIQLLDESKDWKVRKFYMFDREVESPHTCCFYKDMERQVDPSVIADTDYYYSGSQQSTRDFFPDLIIARDLIDQVVNKEMCDRTRDPLEIQGEWKANIAIANRYDDHANGVGSHSDRMTFIGPLPTIASLTLGASRMFRIRRNPSANSNATKQEKFIDIRLPHNSLLIMKPPMQEDYKHEIPKCPSYLVHSHPIADKTRINLTFRVARPEFVKNPVLCKCGNPCDLRVASKSEKNRGKYFYLCARGGNKKVEPGTSCDYFEWFNKDLLFM